jgi:hypothetical protein
MTGRLPRRGRDDTKAAGVRQSELRSQVITRSGNGLKVVEPLIEFALDDDPRSSSPTTPTISE